MRYRLVARHQSHGTVLRLCGLLGVSASGYYVWRRPERESARVREDRRLSQKIRASHRSSRQRYGSPRVHRDLREQGERCSRKRVERLMRQEGLRARSRRRYRVTPHSRHSHPVAENLVNRHFTAKEANRVWVTDMTYLWTPEGFVYLAAVLDLYSRRVVGWALGDRLDQDLPLRALRRALEHRRPAPGWVHHSDRGSQYAAHRYQEEVLRWGGVLSMSRKGDCWDNAVMESFLGTFKRELGDTFASRAQGEKEISEYLEEFYNRRRRHSSLGYQSPVEYEKQARRRVA